MHIQKRTVSPIQERDKRVGGLALESLCAKCVQKGEDFQNTVSKKAEVRDVEVDEGRVEDGVELVIDVSAWHRTCIHMVLVKQCEHEHSIKIRICNVCDRSEQFR